VANVSPQSRLYNQPSKNHAYNIPMSIVTTVRLTFPAS